MENSIPKMGVQTVKIDDDLQSALKKQQRKIDVAQEKEKAEPGEKKDESHVTETNDNKRREETYVEDQSTTGMETGMTQTEA